MRSAIVFLVGGGLACADSSWVMRQEEETFTLRGSYLSSSIVRPTVTLVCSDGKLVSSVLNTFLPVRTAEGKSTVLVSVNGRRPAGKTLPISESEKSLSLNTKFVKNFVPAGVVQIEIPTSAGRAMTAEFHPASANVLQVKNTCGLR